MAEVRRVQQYSHGVVRVFGVVVAPEYHESWPVKEVLIRVRERTSDDWWLRAWEIMDAEEVSNTPGPLGGGVDFFADDHFLAVPPEIRDEIQDEIYEETVALIEHRLRGHLDKMRTALNWREGPVL